MSERRTHLMKTWIYEKIHDEKTNLYLRLKTSTASTLCVEKLLTLVNFFISISNYKNIYLHRAIHFIPGNQLNIGG